MEQGNVIVRFDNVTFEYVDKKLVLHEASFSVRENAKVTIMGQNGAGKTTIFKLITGELKPKEGQVHVKDGARIGVAKQVMSREHMDMTLREFFAEAFSPVPYDLDGRIKIALEAVNFKMPLDKKVGVCSGGQHARLLLAYALIQEPDILLLDEPTNNLDEEGIAHLLTFLIMHEKTVIVVSHDSNFLNSFTDGVLYLDINSHKVDQYVGNYFDAVEKIQEQIEREQRKNAQLQKNILDRKEKVNFFAHKGGKMRRLAAKMREEIAEDEENTVDVRREDKTIKQFTIPAKPYKEVILNIEKVKIADESYNFVERKLTVPIKMRIGHKLLVKGPNGIGKTTLLRHIANREEGGAMVANDVDIGYYRQDFSGLDFNKTAYESLKEVMTGKDCDDEETHDEISDDEKIYSTAARFLLHSSLLQNPIGTLSEGQKGLLTFARFVLQKPSLLILDEPSNHINFRHLPVIAKAINDYEGAVLIVSHDEEFLSQIKIDEELDLGKLRDHDA
jgi:ATPase subunit of ABC transporter with duplicated ATPase domains